MKKEESKLQQQSSTQQQAQSQKAPDNKPNEGITHTMGQPTDVITPKRVYSDKTQVDSDTFALGISAVLKNTGGDGDKAIIEPIDHKHFYRTVDRNGRRTTRSAYSVGHYHEMSTSMDAEGNLIATCGQALGRDNKPLKIYRKLSGGKFRYDIDNHVHSTVYMKSERVDMIAWKDDALLMANLQATYGMGPSTGAKAVGVPPMRENPGQRGPVQSEQAERDADAMTI